MSFTSRDWLQLYETTKRQILNKRQSGSRLSEKDSSSLNGQLKTLEAQLKIMSSSLMEYEIATSEIARRQTLLDNLNKQVLFILAPSGGSGRPGGGGGFGTADSGASGVALNPLQTSDKALIQRQQDVMRLQDDMLVDISRGVDRLHGQALTIGDETKQHIKLIDNLEAHVDDATDALTTEAKHAEEVKRKAEGCYMYICIAVEFVIIIILLLIGFAT